MRKKARPPIPKTTRPRNAAATREAILQSALSAFVRQGYDGVGVREIAQTAGVTAVLVNRYFGSKERLFAAAVEATFTDNGLFEGDASTLAQRLADDGLGTPQAAAGRRKAALVDGRDKSAQLIQ